MVAVIAQARPEDVPALAMAVAARLAEVSAGMATVPNDSTKDHQEADRMLTVEQALIEIGGRVSRKWLLRHTRGLRFRHNHSRKVVMFEEGGLRRWWAGKRA